MADNLVLPALLIAGIAGIAVTYDNGVARTPPMGWNSWNHFGCGNSRAIMEATVDRLLNLGLADAGYVYVNSVSVALSRVFYFFAVALWYNN